jgi:phosphopantetheinyl transferase
MKNRTFTRDLCLYFIVFTLILGFYTEGVAQVAVNADGTLPSPKAILDVKSNTKGMHMPRMTTVERNAIVPAQTDAGLMVFDLDKNRIYMFDGQNWLALALSNLNDVPLTNRVPSDSDTHNDNFGTSVSISGDYAIVGAQNKSVGINTLQGAAYIFYRTGNTWTQQAKLTAADGAANDNFGVSVSISGDYAIVGAHGKSGAQGAAYVFFRTGSTWAQQAKLTAADPVSGDVFGKSVSISGDYVIVAAYAKTVGINFYQGAAYIFFRTGTTWAQQQKLVSTDGAANDAFGHSVSISGDYAIVGAKDKTIGANAAQGAAYIFGRIGASWVQVIRLTIAGGSPGAANDNFGYSVAISGNYAIIGAPYKSYNTNTLQGAAYIFFLSGGVWAQQQYLISADGTTNDIFGFSVAISGDYVMVGADYKTVDTHVGQGATYILKRNGTTWSQKKKLINTLSGELSGDFGNAVGITPNAYIVGEKLGFNQTTGVSNGAVHFGLIDF